MSYGIGVVPGCIVSVKGRRTIQPWPLRLWLRIQRKILSVSQYFWGATNDKTIARYDAAVGELRSPDTFLKNVRWSSHNHCVLLQENVGAYFICDGGYHDWECLMPPNKHQVPGTDECAWSHHIESVRKDVECVFGI